MWSTCPSCWGWNHWQKTDGVGQLKCPAAGTDFWVSTSLPGRGTSGRWMSCNWCLQELCNFDFRSVISGFDMFWSFGPWTHGTCNILQCYAPLLELEDGIYIYIGFDFLNKHKMAWSAVRGGYLFKAQFLVTHRKFRPFQVSFPTRKKQVISASMVLAAAKKTKKNKWALVPHVCLASPLEGCKRDQPNLTTSHDCYRLAHNVTFVNNSDVLFHDRVVLF